MWQTIKSNFSIRLYRQYQGFLATPSLWEGKNIVGVHQFEFSGGQENSAAIQAVKIPQHIVLGKRVECFFAAAIRQSLDYRLLASNIQIFEDKKTLGEFDFFIEDTRKHQQLHIELVYKFYVYDPSIDEELNRWIGPNRKDSLTQKIHRLQKHQLPLLYQKESRSTLKKFDLNTENILQKVCFKANLFLPKKEYNKPFSYLNTRCLVGYWLSFEEFTKSEYGGYTFALPEKQDWLIKPQHYTTIWQSFDEVYSAIQNTVANQKSVLVYMKKDTQTYEQFFVVWW